MKRRKRMVQSWLDEAYAHITKKVGANHLNFNQYGVLQRAIISTDTAIAKGDANRAVYEISKYWRELSKLDDPELDQIFRSKFSSKGGRGKRGRWGPLKSTLQLIVDEIGSSKLDDILNAIEDEALDDVFYPMEGSPKPPAVILDINRVTNKVRYQVTTSGEVKTVSIKNIDNHLTAIRKNM